MTEYKVDGVYEVSYDVGGYNYLLIFGSHINGMFLCVPNWGIGCELAGDHKAVYYNKCNIAAAGLDLSASEAIAKFICDFLEDKLICESDSGVLI